MNEIKKEMIKQLAATYFKARMEYDNLRMRNVAPLTLEEMEQFEIQFALAKAEAHEAYVALHEAIESK